MCGHSLCSTVCSYLESLMIKISIYLSYVYKEKSDYYVSYMTTHGKYNTEQLNDLLNLKEKEWRCVLQEHVDTLVKELAEKDELITLEKLRFHKLKEDFEYNLTLVEDRDKDLQKYEQLFEQMKGNDKLNNHQVSEMKIKIDEFQSKFNLLEKEKEEVQHHYQMVCLSIVIPSFNLYCFIFSIKSCLFVCMSFACLCLYMYV